MPDPQAVTIGRSLEQSTYGPTPALMTRVAQIGIQAFIDEQFATPESPWPTADQHQEERRRRRLLRESPRQARTNSVSA